jgi:hypothetical protein
LVLLLAARIGGQLNLGKAALYNAGGDALSFDCADVKGGVLARGGFKSDGTVRALEARIGGSFDPTARTPCREYPGYPCWHWLPFTMNNVVPAWGTPSPDWVMHFDVPQWVTWLLLLLKVLAWALLALLLAAVTGLLRKT